MLDPKVIELVDRMVRVQFEERREQLQREIILVQNQATMHGAGRSGRVMVQVTDLCAHDIEIRTLIVWQTLRRVISETGIVPSEAVAQDLKDLVTSYRSAITAVPSELVNRVVTNIGIRSEQSLDNALDKAMRKVTSEIDLFVLSLLRRAEAKDQQAGSPQPVFNIYSPVGGIQTGPSATANVVQTLAPQDKEALIKALDLVRAALSDVDDLPANPKGDVIELVAEAESEVGKSSPNQTRLRSILATMASAIQTVGSL